MNAMTSSLMNGLVCEFSCRVGSALAGTEQYASAGQLLDLNELTIRRTRVDLCCIQRMYSAWLAAAPGQH